MRLHFHLLLISESNFFVIKCFCADFKLNTILELRQRLRRNLDDQIQIIQFRFDLPGIGLKKKRTQERVDQWEQVLFVCLFLFFKYVELGKEIQRKCLCFSGVNLCSVPQSKEYWKQQFLKTKLVYVFFFLSSPSPLPSLKLQFLVEFAIPKFVISDDENVQVLPMRSPMYIK